MVSQRLYFWAISYRVTDFLLAGVFLVAAVPLK